MAPKQPLSRERCLELLASVPVGRVVFTLRALPAIRPVNHLLDGETIIIRSSLGASLPSTATERGAVVVAYEADMIDVEARTGWTVVVTGTARLVLDQALQERYEQLLHPWVDEPMNCIIGIDCDLVTGYELGAVR
ncbi:pyridoxamine 5'-phosphate oxidase family protein [Dactylosporangium fulvum]|uniref:Pyridoxamine 5'-phosphate oxidase family protein n=1 Tax=Dactylosporangium fulvum TaxID=53359 RepID=A0ABY5VRB3_9ACTN|nr:pyridoxamine 5'-phosphate oxidase family protein [Dactylosporangium fulvum]UWP79611.1 pyridoxamine 5'-phosphate oxidase family protein [Dactylosporangium fulvum]